MTKAIVQNTDKKLKNITNVLDENTIQLYGFIGMWEDIDWAPFQEVFRKMDWQGNTIKILVNCFGGDVYAGLSIFDLMQSAKAKVEVINEGVAASMGGVLLQGGTPGMRKATKNSRVMVHRPTGRNNGDADDFKEYAIQLETEENKLIDLFVATTGQDKKTVKSWMVRGVDKWFTAQQALEAGLIDEIIEPTTQQNPIPANKIKGKSAEEIWQLYNSHTQPQNQNSDMNKFKMAILAVLAQAAITSVPSETDSDEKWVEALNNATKVLSEKVTAAENKVKAMHTDRATALIENAIATGKLPKDIVPDAKAKMITDAASNYDSMSNTLNMVSVSKVEDTTETPAGEKFDINNALGKTAPAALGKIKFPQGRETWNLDKWAIEDSTGLEELERSNVDLFNKLINDKKAELKKAGIC